MLSKGHASLALYAALHETRRDRRRRSSRASASTAAASARIRITSLPGVDFSTGLARPRALDRRRAPRSPRGSAGSDAAHVRAHERRRVQRGLGLGGGHVRRAPPARRTSSSIVDVNGQQALGYTRDVHRPRAARRALARLRLGRPRGRRPRPRRRCAASIDGLAAGDGRPHVLLAQTVFGHGVSYMEREIRWHYLPMDDDQYATALAELGALEARRGSRMRKAFVDGARGARRQRPRVLLLTGDLGFMAVEPFAERHPDRFINVGVAEQNMVGMATGLAEAGYVPFVYSIATFAALRAYEFIRNGPVLHELPGPHRRRRRRASTTARTASPTGRSRTSRCCAPLPGLTVIAPADDPQTASAVAATSDAAGPGLPAPGAHGPGHRRARRPLRDRSRARARRRRRRCARRARQHGLAPRSRRAPARRERRRRARRRRLVRASRAHARPRGGARPACRSRSRSSRTTSTAGSAR